MAKRLKTSAGLLAFRRSGETGGGLEVLIVHPGGPFWARKDEGAWSLPKGEVDLESEDGLAAARREFTEELGSEPPDPDSADSDAADYLDLGSVTQKAGKVVLAWAIEFDLDASAIVSNTFTMEWPPKSATLVEFPEIDRAEWVTPTVAAVKLNPAQVPLVERLIERLADSA